MLLESYTFFHLSFSSVNKVFLLADNWKGSITNKKLVHHKGNIIYGIGSLGQFSQ